ncbi:MAG: RDD family protein, partial [Chloroflexota bacterium]
FVVIVFFIGVVIGLYLIVTGRSTADTGAIGNLLALPLDGFGVILAWLYFTLAETLWQGTVGKLLVGIKVTDEGGGPISWWRANARYWAKILSMLMLGVGFLMVAFTDRRQGLHDILARTLVVRRRP